MATMTTDQRKQWRGMFQDFMMVPAGCSEQELNEFMATVWMMYTLNNLDLARVCLYPGGVAHNEMHIYIDNKQYYEPVDTWMRRFREEVQ